MNQEDITQIYETLAPMAGDYANAQAEQIGMAQQSMGPLAAATMGQSRTAGLGNYTYNRLMRPQVDTMRNEIRVQGYANQLNRLLSDALNNARNNYNRRGGGGGGDTDPDTTKPGNNTGVTTIDGVDDEESGGGNSNENIPQVFIPNKFLYEKEDGYMQQVARPAGLSNRKWYDIYMKAKEQADRKGRKFINGK